MKRVYESRQILEELWLQEIGLQRQHWQILKGFEISETKLKLLSTMLRKEGRNEQLEIKNNEHC